VNFVLDASVTMSWLLADGKSTDQRYAASVLTSLAESGIAAGVPVTWALEIANVVARAEARGLVTEAQSEAFLEMLSGIRIRPDSATFPRAMVETLSIARRYRLSSYDASYLELALRLGLPLATLDSDLLQAAKKAGINRYSKA
jgi:predicted nucleic acid-binding protein